MNYAALKTPIVIILIMAMFLYPIYIANAFGAFLYYLKEFVLDLTARLIARTVLSRISNSITDTILSLGRGGAPPFVADWRDFLQDSQYRGEKIFRSLVANSPICSYLKPVIENILNVKPGTFISSIDPGLNRLYDLQSYGLRNKCQTSLSPAAVSAFRADFARGGWEAWDQLIKPYNNLWGVYADSVSELGKQRKFEEGTDQNEAQAGQGYTSARKPCSPTGIKNGQCAILGQIVTPGSLFDKSISNTIKGEIEWPVSCDELSECLAGAAASAIAYVTSRLTALKSGSSLAGSGISEGADESAAREGLEQGKNICVEECVDTNCPPGPQTCTTECTASTTDPVTGEVTCTETNETCTPGEPDPTCVSSCESQCSPGF